MLILMLAYSINGFLFKTISQANGDNKNREYFNIHRIKWIRSDQWIGAINLYNQSDIVNLIRATIAIFTIIFIFIICCCYCKKSNRPKVQTVEEMNVFDTKTIDEAKMWQTPSQLSIRKKSPKIQHSWNINDNSISLTQTNAKMMPIKSIRIKKANSKKMSSGFSNVLLKQKQLNWNLKRVCHDTNESF